MVFQSYFQARGSHPSPPQNWPHPSHPLIPLLRPRLGSRASKPLSLPCSSVSSALSLFTASPTQHSTQVLAYAAVFEPFLVHEIAPTVTQRSAQPLTGKLSNSDIHKLAMVDKLLVFSLPSSYSRIRIASVYV